ncbi:MAG: hypothetical protein H7833_09665 [Magnetococcus sp. DMHC-1]|nr:hypothetical protein [Magnetococcales bacterium]MBF0155048.1 hypothetical protein [Magnetococcales bacterium]
MTGTTSHAIPARRTLFRPSRMQSTTRMIGRLEECLIVWSDFKSIIKTSQILLRCHCNATGQKTVPAEKPAYDLQEAVYQPSDKKNGFVFFEINMLLDSL